MKKIRLQARDVDWTRVRTLASKAFRGHGTHDPVDADYLTAAHRADPDRYTRETHAVRAEIRATMNPLHKK